MGLFNRFRDTIFLKKESDLEKQLDELKKIRDLLNDTQEIDKDIRLLEYGIIGENEIEFELKNAHIGMYVLHDVTFEYNGNKAQIDYLLFTRGCFYLIECKNLFGNVTVDSSGQFYREYEYNGKKIKESIYSPYTQAVRHQDMMKKVWEFHHNKFDNLILGNLHGKDFFRPIVVMANSKSILNTKNAPKEIKNDIIRVDQLIHYIQRDIDNMDKFSLFGEKFLKKTAETWLSRTTINDTSLAKKYTSEINGVQNNENLEIKLRLLRKERAKQMNIPAYYIFTDEEMKNIISCRPKNIEDLKKILSDIKVKCHGEEIIKIILDN